MKSDDRATGARGMALALGAVSLGISGLMTLSPKSSAKLLGLETGRDPAWSLPFQAAGVRDLVVNGGLVSAAKTAMTTDAGSWPAW